jgi:tellurite resistance-related uncharacterized protein
MAAAARAPNRPSVFRVKNLPGDLIPYKRTPEFTDLSVPRGLLKRHRTREATWGEIVVLEGSLVYRILHPDRNEFRLRPGQTGIIEPTILHEVEPHEGVKFYIQFYRKPATRSTSPAASRPTESAGQHNMPAAPEKLRLHTLFSLLWDRIEAATEQASRPRMNAESGPRARAEGGSDPERFPLARYLERSLVSAEQSGMGEISALLRQTVNMLTWSQNETYLEAALDNRFIENYVTGMLTGPESNFAPDVPCSGFVLLGPETEYPTHSHAAREVYLVLTPGTDWCLNGAHWFPVEPGQVIYHRSWQNHAMRTHATPMLAFAAWLDYGDRRAITI